MLRRLSFPLSVLFASPVAFAAAAELTESQVRLLTALPTVEQVLAAVPSRKDPTEDKLVKVFALGHFSDLAASIASPTPETWNALQELGQHRFHAARVVLQGEALRSLNPDATSESVYGPTQQRLTAIAQSLRPEPQVFYIERAELFDRTLAGELREYAMSWHERNGGASAPLDGAARISRSAMGLPPPLRKVVEIVVAVPIAVWIALLVAWVLMGIRYRTGPFGLDPGDPFTLMLGRQRKHMGHVDGRVVRVTADWSERVLEHEKRDEYGRTIGPTHKQVFQSLTQIVQLRDEQGREISIKLHNKEFATAQGHRVLAVYDQKSRAFLFLLNRDNSVMRHMPLLESYYRMRPLILIPVWILAAMAANLVSPTMSYVAMVAAPVVYLAITWTINSRRREKFVNEMIPRVIEAARWN